MKLQYTYLEYKEYPRATAISQSRARNQMYLSILAIASFGLCLIMLATCNTVGSWIGGIFYVIISFAAIRYMKTVYPKNTQKKIDKAIEEGIAEQKRIAEIIATGPKGVSFIDYREPTLIVVFKNGLEYRHNNVPRKIYEEFKASNPKEDYYNTHIKNNYPRI